MRSTTPLLSIAVTAAALVAAAPAGAVMSSQRFSASVSPHTHGTKANPRAVALTARPYFSDVSADVPKPFATSLAYLYFDKHIVFNGKYFPSCSKSRVQTSRGTTCPKRSKVGSGTAAGLALGIVEDLKVTVYNGPGGRRVEMLVVGSSPLAINQVIAGTLTRRGGSKYAYRLKVAIPTGLQRPAEGVVAMLTDFNVRIHANVTRTTKQRYRKNGRTRTRTVTRKIPYVGLNGCSVKKLNFRYSGTYTDGSSQTVLRTQRCR